MRPPAKAVNDRSIGATHPRDDAAAEGMRAYQRAMAAYVASADEGVLRGLAAQLMRRSQRYK